MNTKLSSHLHAIRMATLTLTRAADAALHEIALPLYDSTDACYILHGLFHHYFTVHKGQQKMDANGGELENMALMWQTAIAAAEAIEKLIDPKWYHEEGGLNGVFAYEYLDVDSSLIATLYDGLDPEAAVLIWLKQKGIWRRNAS